MYLIETSQVLKWNSSATACTRWRLKWSRASDVTQGKPSRFVQLLQANQMDLIRWLIVMHVQERPGISSDHVAAAEALASSQCSTRSPSSSVWKRSTAALRSSHCEARSATPTTFVIIICGHSTES